MRGPEMKLENVADPEISTRIAQYEMAYRMQASVPDLTDLSNEPRRIFDLYGPESRTPGSGFSARPLNRLKTAALPAMPSVSTAMTTSENPGRRRNWRAACLRAFTFLLLRQRLQVFGAEQEPCPLLPAIRAAKTELGGHCHPIIEAVVPMLGAGRASVGVDRDGVDPGVGGVLGEALVVRVQPPHVGQDHEAGGARVPRAGDRRREPVAVVDRATVQSKQTHVFVGTAVPPLAARRSKPL